MKKIFLVVILLLGIGLTISIIKYNDLKNENKDLENKIENIKNYEFKDNSNELSNLKNDSKEDIEEYEIWLKIQEKLTNALSQ